MKKKILAVFMAIATTLCCAVGLAACGGDNGGTGSGSGEEEIDIQPPHAPSEGLEYELIENGREYNDYANHYIDLGVDGACYAVVGMGTCTDTDLVIPSTHDGLPVVAVYADETKYVDGMYINITYPDITSVYIPDEINYVAAFMHCKKLKSVRLGKNTVFYISQYDEYYAFLGCPLQYITVAKGNKNYHSKNNCVIETESKALIIGTANSIIPTDGSVTSIYHEAFYQNTSLKSLTIPSNITSIGDLAFERCTSLESITIPDSVTSIGFSAFDGCTSLTSVTIGNSVTSIGSYVFDDCSSLSLIDFKGTKAQWKKIRKNWTNTGNYTVQCTDGKLDKEGNEIE